MAATAPSPLDSWVRQSSCLESSSSPPQRRPSGASGCWSPLQCGMSGRAVRPSYPVPPAFQERRVRPKPPSRRYRHECEAKDRGLQRRLPGVRGDDCPRQSDRLSILRGGGLGHAPAGGRRKGQDLRHPQRARRRHRREAGGLLRGPRGSGAPGSGIGSPAALTVWPSVLMPQGCTEKDFTESNVAWLLWGVPAAVLILGSLVSPLPRMLLWTPAFAVAGVACVVNGAHCGRVHCYVTGPLYLLAAIATLLDGMEFVPLRSSWIGGAVVGGTILAYVP